MLAPHVSDLTGPSSGAFYKLYLQVWYVVIRVLLDTSSRYGWTCRVLRVILLDCKYIVNANCNAAPLHRELAADRKTTEMYDFCRYGAQSKGTMGITVLRFRHINH